MRHGRTADVFHLQIDDIVAHHPPDQEFKRKVVDPLHILLVMRLLGRDPSLDELVAHRKRERIVPVAVGGAIAVPRKSAAKMALEILSEAGG